MFITFVIAVAFFAAFIAVGYFGILEREHERDDSGEEVGLAAPPTQPGCCVLCSAPLKRAATSDEVVFEVERRIDAELRDIGHALHSAPDSFRRIFQA